MDQRFACMLALDAALCGKWHYHAVKVVPVQLVLDVDPNTPLVP
jgi:hypothetical protein